MNLLKIIQCRLLNILSIFIFIYHFQDANNETNIKTENDDEYQTIQSMESHLIRPTLNAVVSLVNIEKDLDSLSPNIRSQFLKISKEIADATDETVLTSHSDKVSDSGHGSTVDTDEEVDQSQNEPLDLSVHSKMPTNDDLFEKREHL